MNSTQITQNENGSPVRSVRLSAAARTVVNRDAVDVSPNAASQFTHALMFR